jgi:hypothetical protein
MTRLIQRELEYLKVVPKDRGIELFESVRGQWFTSSRLMKRNMDVGFDDGLITPCLIPNAAQEEPVSIPYPTFDGLEKYGIRITYTISSAYLQNGTLKRLAGTNTDVQPLKDFPKIMEKIEQEAVQKYKYQIR